MKIQLSRVSGEDVDTLGNTEIVLEISSLEELTDIMNKYGHDIIIDKNQYGLPDIDWCVTIFDDYVS